MYKFDQRGYPGLDLSMFLEPNVKFCVRCTTQQDAKNFVSAIMEQYPERTKHWTLDDYKLRTWLDRSHLDLYPDLNEADNWGSLSWDDGDFAEHRGYRIVMFSEIPLICPVDDLGVFVPADELLDELLT